MKHELKEISQTIRELKITIDANGALADYKRVLNEFKKYVAIPGFRKGKAPVSKVEKMYGEHAIEQFYNDKLNDYYKSALDEIDENPINAGEATNIEWEKGKDLVATFRFEVMPKIEVKNYNNLEIPFEETKFEEKMIDETIQDFREKMATEKEIEDKIEEGHTVKATIGFLDEEGNISKEINREFIASDNVYCKSFNNKIIGSKVGDDFTSILFTKSETTNDEEIGEKFRGADFNVKIDSASEKELPELNDEFAKDLEYDSVAQLRETIETELKKKLEQENREQLHNAIVSKLIKENPFELPASLIDKYAEDMAKPYAEAYKMDVEKLIPMYKSLAEFNMKSHYLIEELKKVENINITDEDKEALIAEDAKNANMDLEKFKEVNKSQIESKDFKYIAEEKKLFDLIKKTAKYVALPEKEETE